MGPLGRWAVSVCVCALVVSAGAIAASPKAQTLDAGALLPPNRPFQWDVPKVVEEIDVPSTFDTNGIPNRFHVVVVGLPFAETWDHFYRSFALQGLWIAPPEKQLKLGGGQVALTGFHPNDEISYTVILQPAGPSRTAVILGEAFWKGRTFAPGQAFAPVFPGAENLVTQDLESGRALGYQVKAPRDEVTKFYKDALTRSGYAPQPDGTWLKGTELLQVIVTSVSRTGKTDVALVQMGTQDPAAGP